MNQLTDPLQLMPGVFSEISRSYTKMVYGTFEMQYNSLEEKLLAQKYLKMIPDSTMGI